MALYERLVLPTTADPKIPVHQFMAAVAEAVRGQVTRAQIITAFGLRVEDEADLDFLITKVGTLAVAEKFEFTRVLHDILLLGETGLAYNTRALFTARVNAEPARPS